MVSFYKNIWNRMQDLGHGDIVGSSGAQTPQHPGMSHIPSRLFSSPCVAQMTAAPGAHEMPPPFTPDHGTHDGVVDGESHEEESMHCYPGATHVQSTGTILVKLLMDENLVPLKMPQVPGSY
jgi:hypothetical protein